MKLRYVATELVLVPAASHSSLGARPSQLTAIAGPTLNWFEEQGSPRDVAAGRRERRLVLPSKRSSQPG